MIFPWRQANQFELLLDGPQFFPPMLAALAGAAQQIELELYLVAAGACTNVLVAALCAAAQRGVAVRCLLDDFGCLGLPAAQRRELLNAGVQLRFYNPLGWRRGLRNLYRDHRKLLLVDGRLGFVGGTGATDQFWQPSDNSHTWHEVMVQMCGPLLADWQQLFEHQWQAALAPLAWRPQPINGVSRPPKSPQQGVGFGRVAYADGRQHRDILHSVLRAVAQSQQRIWLATPYFLPSWKLRQALRKAAKRGVDVRLLLTARNTDQPPVRFAGQRYYPKLLRAGVRIFEYQPQFLHLKMLLVDDWVSVGSCNFDRWNLRFNLDANLEAFDPYLSAQVAASFTVDFAQSQEIDLWHWHATPWRQRLQQRLWGLLDRLLVNLLDRRR
jgi:cardiolipin synthase A/B